MPQPCKSNLPNRARASSPIDVGFCIMRVICANAMPIREDEQFWSMETRLLHHVTVPEGSLPRLFQTNRSETRRTGVQATEGSGGAQRRTLSVQPEPSSSTQPQRHCTNPSDSRHGSPGPCRSRYCGDTSCHEPGDQGALRATQRMIAGLQGTTQPRCELSPNHRPKGLTAPPLSTARLMSPPSQAELTILFRASVPIMAQVFFPAPGLRQACFRGVPEATRNGNQVVSKMSIPSHTWPEIRPSTISTSLKRGLWRLQSTGERVTAHDDEKKDLGGHET